MSDNVSELLELVESGVEIPLRLLVMYVEGGNLREWGAVHEAIDTAFARITPAPSMQVTCDSLLRYYLRCLIENPESEDYLLSGFEAGHELAKWAKQMDGSSECDWVQLAIEKELRSAYLKGDPDTRNRIETGALEHILERKGLRKYFESWATHEDLRESYECALAWGKAHKS